MKAPVISPIVRLAIGLSMLTVSLLLVADFLGFIPNSKLAEFNARKVIAESLAVQVSADVMKGDIRSVTLLMRSLQQQNTSINSLGLRTSDKQLISSAGDHLNYWHLTDKSTSTVANILVPIHGKEGRWGSLEVSFKPLNGNPTIFERAGSIITIIIFILTVGFFVFWLFLKRALNELDPSNVIPDRVSAALNILAEGLVILDKSGRIVFVNTAFEQKLGQPSASLIGKNLSDFDWIPTDNDKNEVPYRLPWQLLLDGLEAEHSNLKLYTQLKENLSFTVNIAPIQTADAGIRGVVVTFDDITELENKNVVLERALSQIKHSQREITRQNKKLQILATRDPLTGLLNRRSLFEGFATLLSEMEDDEVLSCIMLDIDHFKLVNDRFGHGTGDMVIKSLSQILSETARSDDLVGRYGGEEFCIVLPGVDEKLAADIAERIRLVVNNHKSDEATGLIPFTASFGVSSVSGGDSKPEFIIDIADKALYSAKKSGRNQVVRWSMVESANNVTAAPIKKNSVITQEKTSVNSQKVVANNNESKLVALPVSESHQTDQTTVQNLHHRIIELEALIYAQKTNQFDLNEINDFPNQIVLIDRIKQSIERSLRLNTLFAILIIDIDTSQIIKNTLGEAANNKVINIVAKRLKQTLRSADSVMIDSVEKMGTNLSRTNSGEFVVLLTDMKKQEETTWIIQRLFSCMHKPVEVEDTELFLDPRIGASVYPSDGENTELLLTHAGIALREAKATLGKEVCLYYSKETNQHAKSQLYMEGELHRAIERNEFSIEYQPVISLETGRIDSFEVLLRWHHPKLGLVSPEEFISIAEHVGLIDDIGNWVLQKACSQLKVWHDIGHDHLTLAINFSVVQFRTTDFASNVLSTIKEADLMPNSLTIEITESALIDNIEMAELNLNELSKAGMRISLDDFGTGYSSLSYLKLFPINTVKIDKSFLKEFPNHAQGAAIVSAIIAMVHSLGLHVIAEGVESDIQLHVLQNLKCDAIQGYLFSKPLQREQATSLLANPANIRQRVWDSRTVEISQENTLLAGVLNHMPKERI